MQSAAAACAIALFLGCGKPTPTPTVAPTPTPTVAPTPTAAGTGVTVLTLRRPSGPEWFGLYLLGKKAGFTRSQLSREEREGVEVLVVRQETEISATVGERTVKRRQKDEKVYLARPGGRLLAFRSERSGDGGDRVVSGRCREASCAVVIESASGRAEKGIPHPGETVEQADAARLAAALRSTVKGAQLEGEQLRVRQMEDRYRGRGRVAGAGVEVEVAVVEEQEEGDRQAMRVSLADDGRIVEERLGESVVARAEPEEVARRLDRVDLFNLTRVPLPHALPRDVPGAIAYRLRGLPESFQKNDERQRFQRLPGGEARLTVTARRPLAADPARDARREEGIPRGLEPLLGPTAETVGAIDSDAPALRALAAQLARGEPRVYAAAQRLSRFVFGKLEKTFGQSSDRASEVLAAGRGDCTEHSLLFTALARAAGIPARPVFGLVYTRYGDGADALYWHAWAEVKSGQEWIALDPTFGQEVADATHLALGRGNQVDTVGLLGALQVVSADPVPLEPRSGGHP